MRAKWLVPLAPRCQPLLMDEILHHFENMGNDCWQGNPGCLRWCEMESSIHSSFPHHFSGRTLQTYKDLLGVRFKAKNDPANRHFVRSFAHRPRPRGERSQLALCCLKKVYHQPVSAGLWVITLADTVTSSKSFHPKNIG